MIALELRWKLLSVENPTWEQITQTVADAKARGCTVTLYNMKASDPGIDSLALEVDEDTATFFPVLMLNPKGMRFAENKNGSAEKTDFNGSEVATGAITDDLPTVLRLAKEFCETGDVKEMKEWKDMFFNTQAG